MHAFELQNALAHGRPGQAGAASRTIRSLFPALLEEEKQATGLEASMIALCCKQSRRLDSKWAIANSSVWDQGKGSQNLVILIYPKTVTGKSCLGSEVEPWPVNSEKQTLVSGHQSSSAMDGLPWEVGSPCHGGCSETA